MLDLTVKLMVLFWGLMMLKVALIFANKPLKYSIIPFILIIMFLFLDVPTILIG